MTEIDTGIRKVKGLGAWTFSYVDLENTILKIVMCFIRACKASRNSQQDTHNGFIPTHKRFQICDENKRLPNGHALKSQGKGKNSM